MAELSENAKHLWSAIDWTLWGHGLNDVTREPIATAMVDAIPTDDINRIVPVMLAWKARRGWPALHEEYAQLRDEIQRLTVDRDRLEAQLDEARHALTRVMPAARTTEEVQVDAGAIRFGWGARFAALLENLLDEDDLMAVLAAWETLLREQVAARTALEAITDPHGAQS